MGVTEAFIVIYGVLVNNYAPTRHSTKWMGTLHTYSALGVVFGCMIIPAYHKLLSSKFEIRNSCRLMSWNFHIYLILVWE